MADKVREAGCPDGYGDRHAAKCENAVVAARVIEGAWGDGYIAGRRAALDAPLAAPSGGDATRDEAVRAALRLLNAPYGTQEWRDAGDALARLVAPNGLKAANAALDATDAVARAREEALAVEPDALVNAIMGSDLVRLYGIKSIEVARYHARQIARVYRALAAERAAPATDDAVREAILRTVARCCERPGVGRVGRRAIEADKDIIVTHVLRDLAAERAERDAAGGQDGKGA